MSQPPVTLALAQQHGLNEEEYARLLEIAGGVARGRGHRGFSIIELLV